MSKNPALGRIEELCRLDLGSQAIMPALLKELHGLVASLANAFIWGDPRQRVENYLAERLDEAAPGPSPRRNGSRRIVLRRPDAARRAISAGGNVLAVDRPACCRHDHHPLVARPPRHDHTLRAIVHDGERALGVLLLHRGASEECFTAQDGIGLASVLPYLVNLLTTPPSESRAPLVDSDDEGLMIVDSMGRTRYLSTEARRLLHLACNPIIGIRRVTPAHREPVLPTHLRRMCRRLVDARAPEPKSAASVWRCRNAWGGFTFRGYWLNRHAPKRTPVIGITVRRQEPLPLKLLRHMRQLPLSGRQAQVCLLLAAGHSRPAISKRLAISEHTAITYTRQIYEKLAVRSRSELVIRLIAM